MIAGACDPVVATRHRLVALIRVRAAGGERDRLAGEVDLTQQAVAKFGEASRLKPKGGASPVQGRETRQPSWPRMVWLERSQVASPRALQGGLRPRTVRVSRPGRCRRRRAARSADVGAAVAGVRGAPDARSSHQARERPPRRWGCRGCLRRPSSRGAWWLKSRLIGSGNYAALVSAFIRLRRPVHRVFWRAYAPA